VLKRRGHGAGCNCPSLARIGTAEAKAAQEYRDGEDVQRQADATPIPQLGKPAQAAVGALAAAPDGKARAVLWRGDGPNPWFRATAILSRRVAALRCGTVRAMARGQSSAVDAA
jgi:hypothetical protein